MLWILFRQQCESGRIIEYAINTLKHHESWIWTLDIYVGKSDKFCSPRTHNMNIDYFAFLSFMPFQCRLEKQKYRQEHCQHLHSHFIHPQMPMSVSHCHFQSFAKVLTSYHQSASSLQTVTVRYYRLHWLEDDRGQWRFTTAVPCASVIALAFFKCALPRANTLLYILTILGDTFSDME